MRFSRQSHRAQLRAALLASSALIAAPAAAQDASWNAAPGSADFNTATNWTPATVPTGVASFGGSTVTSLTFSGSRNIDDFQFNGGAPAYTFTLAGFGVQFNGNGIVNNSANAPTFTLGTAGAVNFINAADAGNATISNFNLVAANLNFSNNSTAGTATITSNGGGLVVTFADNSSAANSTIIVTGVIGNPNTTLFKDASTAGNAHITTSGTSSDGAVTFGLIGGTDTATAGTATIVNNDLGTTNFLAHTSALNANITNNSGGVTNVQDQSTLANATVLNNAGGFLQFGVPLFGTDTATAGNAVITNNGTTTFAASTTAGNAKITTNNGGSVSFSDASTGGNARFITNAGGTFDMSGLSTPGMTAGSIEGAGSYILGAKELTVGGNNMSTEVSGVISGIGGKLTKVGTGTLILSGLNTYTGGTFNCACSTLQLGTLASMGAIVGVVTNEGTFNVINANTSGITSIINDGGTTQFFNGTSASAAIIVNKNNGVLNFFNTSTAGTADITNRDGGITTFSNSSTAGNATITNRVTGGETNFVNTSNAGHAIIVNNGGLTAFIDQSSAANANITNRNGGATIFGSVGGTDTASAGSATITNRETGGETIFQSLTTAGSATIVNNGGTASFFEKSNAGTASITNRNGGLTVFADESSAADATIVNQNGFFFFPSQTVFSGMSTAGNASITNQSFGVTLFVNDAKAGNSIIVNNLDGETVFGTPQLNDAPSAENAKITNNDGGVTIFQAFSTAGSATITTNSGGVTAFFDKATGGNAQFLTNAGGIVDFSQTVGLNGDKKVSAGSIAGAGDYYLGGIQLTVGSNNLSTVVTGTINDGLSPFTCGCGTPGSGASLVKVGTGTLTLSGLNTYSGGTTFAGGTVSVSQEANLGALSGALNFDGGTLQVTGTTFTTTPRTINWGAGGGGFDIANAANTFTVNQVLGGPGGLTKEGPGTLVLSGANSYGGGTTVAGGTLSIAANNNIGTGPLALFNGTTLQLNGFFNFTHPTSIAGDPTVNVPTVGVVTMSAPITDGATPGELVKTGTGTLILTAANTYTGGTFVDRGTLQLGDGGASGSIVGNVLVDTNFAINRSDLFTFGGLISGTGRFQKDGSGTTIFTANNTYTGNTVINSGTLQLGDGGTTGAIAGNVLNAGVLAFNRSNTYAFGGVISLSGAVQQNGTGTTIFNTTHSYTGATTVNAGTLLVNGSIASSSGLTVNAGATVGGTGTLPKTTINGGSLSPGNSIGTITVGNNLTFVGPGNYIVEVSPSAADRTNVNGNPGTATLAGTLKAVGLGGIYTVGTKYTVLNATGGVSGTFANLAISGSFGATKPHIEYDGNNVFLVLDPNALSPFLVGATRNQRAVAGAIDTALMAGSQNAPFLALFNLAVSQLPGALDQLTGEVHASTAGALLDESLYPRSAVLGRLRQASYGGNTQTASLTAGGPQAFAGGEELSALAYGKSPIAAKAPPMVAQPGYDVVFWAQGFGARGKFDADGNAANVRRDLAGFFSGADMRVGTSGRVGIAAGYTGSKYALDGRGSSTVETGHLMGYGGWSFGGLNLRAGGAVAWHTIDTSRTVNFPGFFDSLTAHYDGRTGQIFGEAGYGFALGSIAVEPFAGAAWVHLKTNAAIERGGAAALNVAANAFEVGYSTLGIRAASMIPLGHDMMLVPRASLVWQHAFNDVTPQARLAFIAAPVPFVIAGAPIARDSLLAEAGLDLAIGRNATLGVSYVGQLARNVHDHAAKGKFSWKF